jgi:hypothetical protein
MLIKGVATMAAMVEMGMMVAMVATMEEAVTTLTDMMEEADTGVVAPAAVMATAPATATATSIRVAQIIVIVGIRPTAEGQLLAPEMATMAVNQIRPPKEKIAPTLRIMASPTSALPPQHQTP